MDSHLILSDWRYKIIISLLLIVLIATGLYVFIEYDLFNRVTALINENTPAELFIVMFVILPLLGVPMTFFLLLIGPKFGVVYGLLLLETVLPIQMLITYFLAVTIRKPIINYLENKKNYKIPEVPEDKAFMFSFFFLVFPGLPYAPKLYMLPLAGVGFRYCFWLNWAIQGTLCIPFFLLGKSAADLSLWMLSLTIVLFILLFLFLRWAKKRYTALQE